MKTLIGVACGVAAVALFLIPTGSNPQPPTPNTDELKAVAEVDEAFDTLKRLWLKHNLETAEKLDDGELTTAQEAWDFIASGQKAAREVAFKDIADKEEAIIGSVDDEGNEKWNAKDHSKILKGYVK